MKISELIKRLEKVKWAHGDLQVMIFSAPQYEESSLPPSAMGGGGGGMSGPKWHGTVFTVKPSEKHSDRVDIISTT